MKKNMLLFVIFALLLAALPVSAAGDTLVFGVAADMTGLDPHQQTAFASMNVLELVYSTLVEVNEKMEVVPGMAESWEWSDDGLQLTMKLREGMVFHDDSPVTSADVKYSFERILNEETAAAARSKFTNIASIETPDDLTVVFTFSGKNAAILVDMASTNAAILSKAWMEAGGDLSTTTMGAGPFKLESWEPDNKIILAAHDKYFIKGQPILKKIEYRIIPAEDSILAGVRTGEIDFALINQPATAMVASMDKSVVMMSAPALSYHVLQLNASRDVFKDVKVRQAIACGIDRQEVLDVAALGQGEVTPPAVQPFYKAPLDDLFCYSRDVDKAKALLAEAGNPEVKFTIMAASNEPPTAIAEAQNIQSQLAEIGITVEIETLELGVYVDRWLAADFDACTALNGGGSDPNATFWRYWHSTGNLQKVANFNTPELDKLLEEARSYTDPEVRKGYYLDIQKILAENVPWVWLYVGYENNVMVPSLKGFVAAPNGSLLSLRQVYFE